MASKHARSRNGSGSSDAGHRADEAEDKKESHATEDEDPQQAARHDRGKDTGDRQDDAARSCHRCSSLVGCLEGRIATHRGPCPYPGDHRRAFYGYVAALLADFDRYLDQEHIDLWRDGAAYRMADMWMTDEELNELIRGFVSLLQPYMANPATPDRKRRILRTILLPARDSTPTEDQQGS